MAIETRLYLAPLVEMVEEDPGGGGEAAHVFTYKPGIYLPEYDPQDPERTYHWLETWPADDPEWRFVEVTADGSVHAAIESDPDIVRL